MGLGSPFDYVGYEFQMVGIMVKLLDDLCGGCHTNDDYDNGCKDCPAGQLIYACRDYLLTAHEPDVQYAEYASEEWQAKREQRGGKRESPQQIAMWQKMADSCRPECDVLRAIKAELQSIEPYPGFHSQWIFEEVRNPDPLLRLRELVKDLRFIRDCKFRSLFFEGDLERAFKVQMREVFDQAKVKYDEKIAKRVAERESTERTEK